VNILSIISTLISIISLLAVLFQSIILKKTIDNQIYSSFISNSVEFDKMLIEHPYTRKYIYDNEPVTCETEHLEQIMSAVELVVDITENIEVYKKYIPKSRRQGWLKFVADIENTYAYTFYMEKYGEWFKNDNKS
jgi:hypothetical protein